MFFRRIVLAAAWLVAAMFASVPPRGGASQSVALRRHEVARHRPAPRKPDGGRRRAPASTAHLLHGGNQWRRLAVDRRRAHVGADLRRPAHRIHRIHRGGAVRSEHLVRGQRRRPASARPVDRRRDVQVDRRRTHVDETRPQRRAADPAHRRRSAQPQPPVRRCARPSVRAERGARHLPIARRRQVVPEGALQGREHGRARRRHRPCRSERRLRHAVGGAAGPVGERGVGGHGRRGLQVDRRRDHLEAAHQRAPPVVQANLAISPADHRRLYAAVAFTEQPGSSGSRGTTGIFRSDDAGRTWTRITTDARPSGRIGGGDLPVPIPTPVS